MKAKILKLEQGYIEEKADNKREKLKEKKDQEKFYKALSNSLELGFSISLPIAGGALLGSYLDRNFNTHPKITLSLLIVGLILAGVNIYKITKV